jgi:hypothetical protein
MNNEIGTKMTNQSREIQLYGMTTEDIREQYVESLTAKHGGIEMVIAGILSDTQEMLANGDHVDQYEYVRQQLNIAKHLLFTNALLKTSSVTA